MRVGYRRISQSTLAFLRTHKNTKYASLAQPLYTFWQGADIGGGSLGGRRGVKRQWVVDIGKFQRFL